MLHYVNMLTYYKPSICSPTRCFPGSICLVKKVVGSFHSTLHRCSGRKLAVFCLNFPSLREQTPEVNISVCSPPQCPHWTNRETTPAVCPLSGRWCCDKAKFRSVLETSIFWAFSQPSSCGVLPMFVFGH